MNFHGVLIWGFLATIVLTTIEGVGRGFGFTRTDIPFILGTVFTSHRDRAKWIGFLINLLMGWIFALFYIAAMQASGMKHWWFGMFLGLLHGAFVLTIVTTALPAVHPRMATEEWGPDAAKMLEPPGFFAMNYGKRTPIVTLLAHLVYGGILGMFY